MTTFRIKLVQVGAKAPCIRWQLYAPEATKPFLEARKPFHLRIEAYRDAETFLARMGKQSRRDSV